MPGMAAVIPVPEVQPVLQKTLTLAVSLKLQQLLETKGAKVIMTKVLKNSSTTKSVFFLPRQYAGSFGKYSPELVPTSRYMLEVRLPLPLCRAPGHWAMPFYRRMLELGLNEYGNNVVFNFMLTATHGISQCTRWNVVPEQSWRRDEDSRSCISAAGGGEDFYWEWKIFWEMLNKDYFTPGRKDGKTAD